MLGIAPDTDREGCLQDIHWFDGSWGYFPTYTLGAMIAAQMFAAVRETVPGVEEAIAAGSFQPLFAWLRERVHGQGSLMSTAALVESATGSPLRPPALNDTSATAISTVETNRHKER